MAVYFTPERYIKRLEERFGEMFLTELEALKHDPFLAGSDVARKFGLTRERIRQLCNRLYGEGFLSIRKKYLKEKKKMLLLIRHWRRNGSLRLKAYAELLEKLEYFGLEPRIYGQRKQRLILLSNKKLLMFRVSLTQANFFGHRYFVIHLKKKINPKIDFMVVAVLYNNDWIFYIFPKDLFMRRSYICIDPSNQNSTYNQYKGRWELLEEQSQVPSMWGQMRRR